MRFRVSDLKRTINKNKKSPLCLTIPIPPSVNKIHYTDRKGVRRLTSHSENYIRATRIYLKQAIAEQQFEMRDDDTWYYLDLVFKFPDRRTRDSHNCLKILMDALEGYCFKNDYFVMPRIQAVEYDKKDPCVIMVLSEQTEEERAKYLHLVHKQV